MPIYEFFCPDNRRIYSFFARSLRYSDKLPRCPDNPKWKMEKVISGFAITGRAKESNTDAMDELEDSKVEAAMSEMEREFSSLGDTDNPDPRAVAKMMRRMGEISGQKMPAEMNEVIARLEKGEDPDKLEAEYGDIFNAMEEAGEPGDDPADAETRTKLRLKKKITRDPKLYEMGEYCE